MFRSGRIAIASLVLVGCSSDANLPAGTLGFGGMGGGASGGTGGALGIGGASGGTGGAGGRAGAGGTGGAAGTGGTGNVAAAPTGTPVFRGRLPKLLNSGPACTFEAAATGDRWCGFFADTTATPISVELFVVNVTKAAAGVPITCGLPDPNCLKLTAASFQDPSHPEMFQGDTLIYYDATGTPFGWRPGMPQGRALAVADPKTMDLSLCYAATKGTAVVCLRVLPAAMQTIQNVLQADLLAGRLDSTADPPLARIETLIATSLTDRNISRFRAGYPIPGGDLVAWSARAVPGGPEVLKTQTLGDDASRATVASDANRWRTSADGSHWYWYSQVDDDTRAGTLHGAPFPGGAGPAAITANALQFDFPTPTSLLTVASTGEMRVFPDLGGAPGNGAILDVGVFRLLVLGDQGYVAYNKAVMTANGTQFSDLYVTRADGTGACTLTAATDGYPAGVRFTPGATGSTWIQRGGSGFTARYTRLADCATVDIASAVARAEPFGDRGVLYLDEYSTGAQIGTLRFRALAGGGVVPGDPGARVSGEVGGFTVVSATSSGGADALIYAVESGGSDDGIYVRAFGP